MWNFILPANRVNSFSSRSVDSGLNSRLVPACGTRTHWEAQPKLIGFNTTHTPAAARPETDKTLLRQLSKKQIEILMFYYVLHTIDGIAESDYSRKELALRMKLSPQKLSTYINELERLGLMGSRHCGSRNKIRWITWGGICLLDDQQLHQRLHQKLGPSLYRSHDLGERDQSGLLLEQQEEEFFEKEEDEDLETKLTTFMNKNNVPQRQQADIKRAINQSQIGLTRKSQLIRRVVSPKQKRSIESFRGYFLACLANEERAVKNFKNYLNQKGINVSLMMQT